MLRAVWFLALAVWAGEELARGTNGARRLLGTGALVYLVVRLTDALG